MVSNVIESIMNFAVSLAREGVTETIKIENAQLFWRVHAEFAQTHLSNIKPEDAKSVTIRSPGPDVEISKVDK